MAAKAGRPAVGVAARVSISAIAFVTSAEAIFNRRATRAAIPASGWRKGYAVNAATPRRFRVTTDAKAG